MPVKVEATAYWSRLLYPKQRVPIVL